MIEPLAQRFIALFATLDRSRVGELAPIYGDDVVFVDPFGRVEGLPALLDYLRGTYANVQDVRFDCEPPTCKDNEAFVRWRMHYRHPRLAGGRALSIVGLSYLRGDERIRYHEDYYDAGGLVYEHVPLVGAAVRLLKRRLHADG